MLYRFMIDCAIPEAVYNAIPAAKKTAIRDRIRELKSYAIKINEGTPNEEMTVTAKWHKCHHDTNELCEPEQDI
mgnify:CR=1 FL=1